MVTLDPKELSIKDTYKLLIGVVVPRPIAWVSSLSADGIRNLAPFSFFNGICSAPPTVCFSIMRREGNKKDTLTNIEATREFVVNVVDEAMADRMNLTSADFAPEVDEFVESGVTPVESLHVAPPRVGESPVQLECRLVQVVDVGHAPHVAGLVIGEILAFHLREDVYLGDGRVDPEALRAIGRMAGADYCRTRDRFSMLRPVLSK